MTGETLQRLTHEELTTMHDDALDALRNAVRRDAAQGEIRALEGAEREIRRELIRRASVRSVVDRTGPTADE